MMRALHVLVGAGGFGKEVMPIYRAINHKAFVIFGDENERSWDSDINGTPVWSLERVSEEIRQGRPCFYNIAIGDSNARFRLANWMFEHGAVPECIQGSPSNVQPHVIGGEAAIICPFVTINASARIGRFFHANIYSYVAHDCVVGDYVTFAPAVKLNGHCRVGDHAYLGTGAVVLPSRSIGSGAVIGAGSVVTKDVPAGETWAGVPARRIK